MDVDIRFELPMQRGTKVIAVQPGNVQKEGRITGIYVSDVGCTSNKIYQVRVDANEIVYLPEFRVIPVITSSLHKTFAEAFQCVGETYHAMKKMEAMTKHHKLGIYEDYDEV